MSVLVPLHPIKTFTSPVNNGAGTVDANIVRTNDNLMGTAYNAHDADSSIHVQSGLYSERPASAKTGALYTATDKDATYFWTGSAWDQIWSGRRYGAWQSDQTQTVAAINTPTLVTLNITDIPDGVTLGTSSRLIAIYPGVYNVQWSGQLINTDSQIQDVDVWLRLNGTDVAGSDGQVSVPNKHGSVNGHALPAWNYFVSMNTNDYLQLYWASTSTAVTLSAIAASTSVPHPSAASVIVTMAKV